MPEKTEIITDAARLGRLIDELLASPRVALDIEADGFYNYAERVCIVTLSTERGNYVVDPLAVGEAAVEFGRLTSRADAPLLLHSGQNDVLAMKRDYDVEFGFIQDTSVAATLLGLPLTGLAALVESYLGVALEKELQRHDWSRRPIELDHVRYLINDTRHLFALHDLMLDELRKHELVDEYEIECRAVAAAEPKEREFDPERYRRIKGHAVLTDRQRGALKALYAWRDALARQLHRAPFRIISDSSLLELASDPPPDVQALAGRRGIGEWLWQQSGAEILQAIQRGLSQPSPPLPPRRVQDTPTERMDPRQRDMLGKLKRWREREREARGVGLQAVLPTAVLRDLVLSPPRSQQELAAIPRVGKARAERYGTELLRILNGRREG